MLSSNSRSGDALPFPLPGESIRFRWCNPGLRQMRAAVVGIVSVRNRSPLTLLLFSVWVSSLSLACDTHPPPTHPAQPKRIILIVIDTLRQDHVSVYGAQNSTPNIDALAERGQLFPNALASYFQTTMSMASLFTGRTPSLESHDPQQTLPWNGRTWCGMRRFSPDPDDPACIPESLTTMAESLRYAGYHTMGIINNALLFRPLGFDQGFEEWVEVGKRTPQQERRNPDAFGLLGSSLRDFKSTLEAVEATLDARPKDRFFLYVHLMDVHDYALMKGQNYAAAVGRADRGVGRIIRALEERGLLEDSVVLLTSDHGERLGEEHFAKGLPFHFGHPSFEEHLRIPMIIAPAVVENPDRAIRSDDVYRMILSLANVAEPNRADLDPDELFISESDHLIYRQGSWKSFVRRDTGNHTLIHLTTDPAERIDVSADHPEIVANHLSRIRELRVALSAARSSQNELTEEDQRRLRALGYLD